MALAAACLKKISAKASNKFAENALKQRAVTSRPRDVICSAMSTSDSAFGVYVHWPFCLAKCPYCDFNSHVRHEAPDEARFTRAIAAELAHVAGRTAEIARVTGSSEPSVRNRLYRALPALREGLTLQDEDDGR
jgi:coproporphyrinogen III oxidase-like Fe-S oxidoreductase